MSVENPARASSSEAIPRTLSPRRRLTETERNWLSAAGILVGSILVFGVLYFVEMSLGRWDSSLRLVLNPAETATRYLGISHFLIAALFMATSRRLRAPRARTGLVLLLAAGVLLCLGYARLKDAYPLLASAFFFSYFLVHELRDEVFFYFVNGDAPRDEDARSLRTFLVWTPFLVLSAVATIAAAGLASGLVHSRWVDEAVGPMPVAVRVLIGSTPAVILGIAILRIRGAWANVSAAQRLRAFLRANRPILVVFAGTLLVLLARRAYAIVILHVAAWYVFSVRQMKKRSASGATAQVRGWDWLRSTPAGFRLLHLGSAGLLVVLGAVWAYGFRNNPALVPFAVLLQPSAFAYWTLVHVTVSYSPR